MILAEQALIGIVAIICGMISAVAGALAIESWTNEDYHGLRVHGFVSAISSLAMVGFIWILNS
jgi:hypothetical protein